MSEIKVYGTLWTCACCGKRFRTPDSRLRDWGYAVGDRACCSYKCMRELDQRIRDRQMAKLCKSMGARIYADWCRGMSYAELAEKYERRPKDINVRMMMLEAMHPDLAEWIQEKARRECLAERRGS